MVRNGSQEGDPGHRVVFTRNFPTESGRARLVPADIISAAERPDDAYPFVLITGRQFEHWHTGSMTRRARVLDAIEPAPVASMNAGDLSRLGVRAGDVITIASRRGRVSLFARADEVRRPERSLSPSATTKPPPIGSQIRCSTRSARFPNSSIAR